MKIVVATLAVLTSITMSAFAHTASAAESTPTPMFVVMPAHGAALPQALGSASGNLQTWQGTIEYNQNRYPYTMVGRNPLKSNATTTIAVYLVPVKLVYGASNGDMTFDPLTDRRNGVSIVQNLLNSPLFNSLDWKWGRTDFGNTQYEDAFQRGSFWKDVSRTSPDYHVLLAPSVLSEVSLKVSSQQGSVINNPFGAGVVGTLDIGDFDAAILGWLQTFSQINPGVLPLFVTDNVYLTQDGDCCVGGYNAVETSGQTYAYATFVTSHGAFSEDVAGFSHVLGEWMDAPLATSSSPCGPLDPAGPLASFPDYGTFKATYGGVTWHLQTLAWLEYFGAKARFSGNNWLDNQHLLSSVCQNGP